MSAPHFEAVLFDCDGVLVDSETLTNGVLRQAGAYHVFDDMALLPGLLGL